jgi:transcriptional regulator of arginine metabolism
MSMSTIPAVNPQGKNERHQVILALVRDRAVRTQEEIVDALRRRGLEVTQATVSRDIKELGLARVHDPDGPRYVITDTAESPAGSARLRSVMREHVRSMEFVGHLGVIRTRPSTAPLVAALIDQSHLEEVAGTVAGDDTILVVIRSVPAAKQLAEKLRTLVGRA